MNKIVAIVGMCGSGKTIASEYFEKKGYKRVYYGAVNLEKVKEAGLEINEKNERYMREKLRKDFGMGAFSVILHPRIEEYSKESNVVLDGLYSWDELKLLNDRFGNKIIVVAIITDKQIRYERLKTREIRPLNYEEASTRDVAEIENLAKGGPIAYGDYFIFNNLSIEEYTKRLEEVIKVIEIE